MSFVSPETPIVHVTQSELCEGVTNTNDNPLVVNQRILGSTLDMAFADLLADRHSSDPSLEAFLTHRGDFGRYICSLASTATCVNLLAGRQLLGHENTGIFFTNHCKLS